MERKKVVADRIKMPPQSDDNNARNLRPRSGGAQQSLDDAVVATRRPLHGRMDSQLRAPVRLRAVTPASSSSGQSCSDIVN